jgi:hypothetical protein
MFLQFLDVVIDLAAMGTLIVAIFDQSYWSICRSLEMIAFTDRNC